jgi:hypothetical protein
VPRLKPPGARTDIVYLWAIPLGPLFLLVAGVVLLVTGFLRHVDSVAAIGAVGIVSSILLPRMQGPFKIGPSGIEGEFESDFGRRVFERATATGKDADQATEMAADATGEPPISTTADLHSWRWLRTSPTWTTSRGPGLTLRQLTDLLANQYVRESEGLDRQTAEIVERVAGEKGWQVERDVRVGPADGPYRIFDFVVTTQEGLIYIEAYIYALTLRQPEGTLANRLAAIDGALKDAEFSAAFVVMPNVPFTTYLPENVDVVPIGDLERRLRELPA